VLLGASQTAALGFFGVFTAARLVHSFVYLAGLQPWRTLSFAVSDLATLVMTGDIVRRLFV
jgi:glutathione S-transferase